MLRLQRHRHASQVGLSEAKPNRARQRDRIAA